MARHSHACRTPPGLAPTLGSQTSPVWKLGLSAGRCRRRWLLLRLPNPSTALPLSRTMNSGRLCAVSRFCRRLGGGCTSGGSQYRSVSVRVFIMQRSAPTNASASSSVMALFRFVPWTGTGGGGQNGQRESLPHARSPHHRDLLTRAWMSLLTCFLTPPVKFSKVGSATYSKAPASVLSRAR